MEEDLTGLERTRAHLRAQFEQMYRWWLAYTSGTRTEQQSLAEERPSLLRNAMTIPLLVETLERVFQRPQDGMTEHEATEANVDQLLAQAYHRPGQPNPSTNQPLPRDQDDDHHFEGEPNDDKHPNACQSCEAESNIDPIRLPMCGHIWCRDCLNYNVRYALSNRLEYPAQCCPELPNGIDLSLIREYLDEDNLARFTRVGEEWSCENATYCFNPRCGQFIPGIDGRQPYQWATCQHCQTQTCVQCKAAKELHPSPDQHPDLLSKDDKELMETKGWKQCPECRKIIEKMDGCDHMDCECGCQFCYICGHFIDAHEDQPVCTCSEDPDPELDAVPQEQHGERAAAAANEEVTSDDDWVSEKTDESTTDDEGTAN